MSKSKSIILLATVLVRPVPPQKSNVSPNVTVSVVPVSADIRKFAVSALVLNAVIRP